MFDQFSIYSVIGLVGGLALFLLLFRRYDLPGWCRRRFALHARIRAVGFALFAGVAIAFITGLLLAFLQLPVVPSRLIEGVAIGFNCAVLVGVVRPVNPGTGGKPSEKAKPRKQTDSRGRRRKG